MARRRTTWISAVETDGVALAGAAAPGPVVNETLVSEAEHENTPGATVVRVVGDFCLRRTAGSPIVTWALWWAPNYVGAVLPTDWTQDVFERESVMLVGMFAPNIGDFRRYPFDVRTKRKISKGTTLVLSVQNHTVAGNDAQIMYNLRSLLLLP